MIRRVDTQTKWPPPSLFPPHPGLDTGEDTPLPPSPKCLLEAAAGWLGPSASHYIHSLRMRQGCPGERGLQSRGHSSGHYLVPSPKCRAALLSSHFVHVSLSSLQPKRIGRLLIQGAQDNGRRRTQEEPLVTGETSLIGPCKGGLTSRSRHQGACIQPRGGLGCGRLGAQLSLLQPSLTSPMCPLPQRAMESSPRSDRAGIPPETTRYWVLSHGITSELCHGHLRLCWSTHWTLIRIKQISTDSEPLRSQHPLL